jgi:hypothetical protein
LVAIENGDGLVPPWMAAALRTGMVGFRVHTLGGLRDPDTVIEDAMAIRIREQLDEQVGRKGRRRGVSGDA